MPKIERLDLEEYVGFIGEPQQYKNPHEYNLKRIENKINEIIDSLNKIKE